MAWRDTQVTLHILTDLDTLLSCQFVTQTDGNDEEEGRFACLTFPHVVFFIILFHNFV